MINDELSKKNKQKNERDIKIASGYYDEEEETYMYDVRKPMEFINESEGGVFDISKQTGINTAKSVFDRTASFKTR
ncbi:MAG: hypothetical protein J6W58_03955 [Lachnospiraceae bacterium]|nr:hypothetical protein [Lachnospiraceae bacterium]MBP5415889.1 hypothetical protein [Lachnospiraceae bacterium]MBP5745437.1 hypothetical protein [Lachnospiraceae bacterium]